MQELEALALKFKEQQVNPPSFDDDETREERKRDSTMAGYFDENMKQVESTDQSINKKMSVRRMTKKIDGTILNRHKNVVCIVHNGIQTIQ